MTKAEIDQQIEQLKLAVPFQELTESSRDLKRYTEGLEKITGDIASNYMSYAGQIPRQQELILELKQLMLSRHARSS